MAARALCWGVCGSCVDRGPGFPSGQPWPTLQPRGLLLPGQLPAGRLGLCAEDSGQGQAGMLAPTVACAVGGREKDAWPSLQLTLWRVPQAF